MLIDINGFAKELLELEHLYISADIALRNEEDAIQREGLFKRMSYAVLGSTAKTAVQARYAYLTRLESKAQSTIAAWLDESVELGLAESGKFWEVDAHATRRSQLKACLSLCQALTSGLTAAKADLQCAAEAESEGEATTYFLAARSRHPVLSDALDAFLRDVPIEPGHATLRRLLSGALRDIADEQANPAFDFKRHCLNAADALHGIRLNIQGLCHTVEIEAQAKEEAIDEIECPIRMACLQTSGGATSIRVAGACS